MPVLRENLVIVMKGGIRRPTIRPGRPTADFANISNGGCAAFRRLGIETIDVYLLHRPDSDGPG
jgi:aryl-alcohol dehydrogenase-like predicted oxidoreductase